MDLYSLSHKSTTIPNWATFLARYSDMKAELSFTYLFTLFYNFTTKKLIKMDFDLNKIASNLDTLSKKEVEKYSESCTRHFLSLGLENPSELLKQRNEFELCRKITLKFKEHLMEEIGKK